MDTARFDDLSRTVAHRLSRRGLAGTLGLAVLTRPGLLEAKKKRKKRKKKVKFNEFGCVNVGMFCQNGGQCCSGICQGKKGKKSCRSHDVQGCEAGQDPCAGSASLPCTTSAGVAGGCVTTTGNAGYCAASLVCSVCAKDVDCEPILGPGAACVRCSLCDVTGETICVGRQGVS